MDRSTSSRPRFSVAGSNPTNSKKPPIKTPGRASIQQPSYYSGLANNSKSTSTSSTISSSNNNNINNNNNNNNNYPTNNTNNFNDITPIKYRPSIGGNSARPNLGGQSSTLPTFLNEGTTTTTSTSTTSSSSSSVPTLNNKSSFFNKLFTSQSQQTNNDNNNNNNNNNNNINNQSDYEMMDYPNDSYISNTSNVNKFKLSTPIRSSNNLVINTPNSLNNSGIYYSNTPAKTRKKPFTEKIRDVVNYPIDKLDEFQEMFLTFNHSKYYSSFVYGVALFLNFLLLAYSIDLLNNFFAFLLISISIGNSIYYFSSSKTSYLYRYENTEFKSPNMSITQIESPTGSIDNVVVLKSWEPKFFPRIIFTLFSPLHVFLMITLAGPEFDSFVIYTLISIVICLGLHYLNEKYNQYTIDQNILFTQLCQEYNHFMRVIPETREKSSQTSDYSYR